MPAAMQAPIDSRSAQARIFWNTFAIFAVALAALVVIYVLRVSIPRPSLRSLGGGDPYEYDRLAKSLLRGEGFSNVIWGLRTPIFPLFVTLIYAIVGAKPYIVVLYNLVFGALVVVMVYKLAVRLLADRAVAALVALLLAFEVAHLDAAVTMMSEPLHNLFLFIALFWLVVAAQTTRWGPLLAAGLAMGLAQLTRPVSFYMAFLLALALIVYRRALWKHAAAFVAICVVFASAWSYRNLYYVNNFSLTTTGSYTTLFYKMVSVESHATGRPPEEVGIDMAWEVEQRLGNDEVTREEIAEYSVGRSENLHSNDPARQELFRTMIAERVRAYPAWTAIMTGVSLVKMFDANRTIRFPASIQLALMAVTLLLALVGYWRAWKDRRWLFLLLSHCVILYYAGTTAIVISGLYHIRYRTPFMPFILMYSALGIAYLYGLLMQKRPTGSPRHA
jgi:4-amino-4-deoxy-L-arabinose transferase-like glycosyltransferase